VSQAEPVEQNVGEEPCPVERTARLVGDRWTLLIVRDLAEGCKRFGELERTVEGISPRTLSMRLSKMEEEGLVIRRQYPEIPPRVEYSLTEMGQGLIPIIEVMREYGDTWLVDHTADA
jgi:DNA-binding HxlR family transcriptional regulator